MATELIPLPFKVLNNINFFRSLVIVCAVLSVATAALSRIGFQAWVDNIIVTMTSTNPAVYTRGKIKEPRLYHHILARG